MRTASYENLDRFSKALIEYLGKVHGFHVKIQSHHSVDWGVLIDRILSSIIGIVLVERKKCRHGSKIKESNKHESKLHRSLLSHVDKKEHQNTIGIRNKIIYV